MKISVHCLVKNEERFVWYAVNSVINYVDEVLVWDNGSTDNTKSMVKLIDNPKIKFAKVPGPVAEVRQKMLAKTSADWFFILDGDEIWPESALNNLREVIDKSENDKDVIVSPTRMLVGDIFHYQEEKAGRYRIAGKVGHYNIRAVRRGIPGLHVTGVYPNEAYVNKNGVKVQNFPEKRIHFLAEPYLHASFLNKGKHEIGISFPKDYYYPEVLFRPRPSQVPSPWRVVGNGYKFRAFFETPLRKLKRRLT